MLSRAERAALRSDIEAMLPDECKVTRPSAIGAFDANTGSYAASPPQVLYQQIACRISPENVTTHVVQAGEEPVSLNRYVVTLPMDTPGVAVDDRIEVTFSRDPDLVGLQLRVTQSRLNSLAVQRRFACELVT